MNKDQIIRLKQIVESGGGIWCGIQEGEGEFEDLVLFNSPQTHTTLALAADKWFTVEAVKNKLAASNLNFGRENDN